MNKEVIISIVGNEKPVDIADDSSCIELITEGKYYKKGNKHYLSYNETEMTGFDGLTTTLLQVDGDTVSLTRTGGINSHMVFREGEKHIGHYDTPYGSFTIGICSEDVSVDIGEAAGDIHIKYLLEINNASKARHDLRLNIREA